ncbi:hypothetical protein [Mixta gaviniae]|uniref:DNA-binding protein n=1 Tax=Mixta gaviniae TaxID=665914 RepID=A0A1X1DPY3_9GAMM|nr:hypothetical protein [Mixta gaviniae]AUX93202.1 hypothetical protein C2E15_09005 [Mixta gaviniae]ORM78633.1 hypothetical protein HA44_12700 [Mixta gaviniae]
MGRLHVTALEFARYAGIKERDLIRAICNRGAIEGVALPEALNHDPLPRRLWLREDVVFFSRRLRVVRARRSHH